jgi:hypothetical protein
MTWWLWTGAACLVLTAAVVAVMAGFARSLRADQGGLDWGPAPGGVRDAANKDFEQWLHQHVAMELDFRGPGVLPFNRPPGMTVEDADWNAWWVERLSYCDEKHYAHPELARWQIVHARREAGLPELAYPASDGGDQVSSGK